MTSPPFLVGAFYRTMFSLVFFQEAQAEQR